MRFGNGRRFVHLPVFMTATLLMAGLAACSSFGQTVAEDDPEATVPNASLGRSIMEGIGAVPPRQQGINYRPRAPLVVPQSKTTLVAPENADKAASIPDWPKDPEVETRERLKAAEAREAGRDQSDRTPPSELLATRLPSRQGRSGAEDEVMDKPLMPHQFAGMKSSGIDSSGVYDASGTPRRRALVEPPVSYLEPAPGAEVTTKERPKPTQSFWKRVKFW